MNRGRGLVSDQPALEETLEGCGGQRSWFSHFPSVMLTCAAAPISAYKKHRGLGFRAREDAAKALQPGFMRKIDRNKGESIINRPLTVVLCAGALIVMCKGAVAGEDPKVAAEVIAITRAEWAAEAQGKSVAEQNAAPGRRLYGVQPRTIPCASMARR